MCNEHRRTVEVGRISETFAQSCASLCASPKARRTWRRWRASGSPIRPRSCARRGERDRARPAALELAGADSASPSSTIEARAASSATGRSGCCCLILADGFYEYTAPAGGGGKGVKKDRWLFTKAGGDLFCIAGIWRTDAKVGEACTMLTAEPGARRGALSWSPDRGAGAGGLWVAGSKADSPVAVAGESRARQGRSRCGGLRVGCSPAKAGVQRHGHRSLYLGFRRGTA